MSIPALITLSVRLLASGFLLLALGATLLALRSRDARFLAPGSWLKASG